MNHPTAGVSAPMVQTQPSTQERHGPSSDLLTDDICVEIIKKLKFRDKLAVQLTCHRFYGLLASPTSTNIWGKLTLAAPDVDDSSDVLKLCDWVLRRLEGISALCYVFQPGDMQQTQRMTNVWHALVAATAGSAIRLKLDSACPPPWSRVLLPPSLAELAQRLTALSLAVMQPADIAAVHSLAALRHLELGCPAGLSPQLLSAAGAGVADCQLSGLRTLMLVCVPPAAFFQPGTAARLPQLHSLACHKSLLVDGALPPEMLRLQSLTRLELLKPPLRMMPDLRGLPALRWLIMSGKDHPIELDASQSECDAELRAALRINPLGGAMGLTAAILHAVPIATREVAEAIARLPRLQQLGVDFLVSEEGAFWAAMLLRRMQGRCQAASDFFTISPEGVVVSDVPWPDNDW